MIKNQRIFVYTCLFVYLLVCLSIYLFICPFIYLTVCASVYLSVNICPSVYQYVCLSIYLPTYYSICRLSFYLSIYLTSIVLEARLFCLVSLSKPESELGESIIFITTYLSFI